MSRSFGTLVQLNTLLQVCTKLGLTRDGRMPDLGSDQGAKHKASELRARRGLGLFTELFTVRYTVVTIGSAPGATDISDHPQAPLGWRVADKVVEGSGSRANLALQKQKLSRLH